MTSVRLNRAQVMDNLNKTAQDLVRFVLSARREELVAVLEEVKQKYQQPSSSFWPVALLQRGLHLYSRQRTPAINELLVTLQSDNTDSYQFLESIANFMKTGNFESTSANTLLLLTLIDKHPAYKSVDEDERFGKEDLQYNVFKMGVVKSLKEAFVTQAENEVGVYGSSQKNTARDTLPEPGKLDVSRINLINDKFAKGQHGSILTRPERRPTEQGQPANVVKVKYASVIANLEKVYRSPKSDVYEIEARRLGAIDVSDAGVSASFASARASLGLFMQKKQSTVSSRAKKVRDPATHSQACC